MLNLIIFGPPGAGKGTQAELSSKKYGLTHLSSGELLRKELKNGELGGQIKKCQDSGQLVPDSIIIAMVEKAVRRQLNKNGIILDGYPRNIKQAEKLDLFLSKNGQKIDKVINIRLGESEASRRMLLRGKTSGRSDDNLKTIKSRHKIYREQTKPLLDYYRQQKKIISIDGRPTIKEVFKKIETALDSI